MKIVIADHLSESAIELLRSQPGWKIAVAIGRPRAALFADLADADALIIRSATRVDRELLSAAPRLRLVARAGNGVDNVDLRAATARGILVVNSAGASSISVAEHTLGLMLSLARSIPAADRALKNGRWEKRQFLGSELSGKTLGVVGLGRIGQEVVRRALAFDMQIVAHDPFVSPDAVASPLIRLVSLDALCAVADFITLHLPSTPTTKHLLNDDRFALCKPGVRIVNTARGELIDEAALRRAIDDGIVKGAALDVFESEPPSDWSLATHPQVVGTPHIAASTDEAQDRVGMQIATDVCEFLREGIVRSAINFPALTVHSPRQVAR